MTTQIYIYVTCPLKKKTKKTSPPYTLYLRNLIIRIGNEALAIFAGVWQRSLQTTMHVQIIHVSMFKMAHASMSSHLSWPKMTHVTGKFSPYYRCAMTLKVKPWSMNITCKQLNLPSTVSETGRSPPKLLSPVCLSLFCVHTAKKSSHILTTTEGSQT